MIIQMSPQMDNKHLTKKLMRQIIYGFILFNCVGTKANELEKYLPAYAVAVNSDILLNSTCKTELEIFRAGIDQKILWSLKVLDASGEPRPGFVYGNNLWPGIKSQCLDLENTKPLQMDPDMLKNNSKYRNINEEFPPYHLNYFVALFYHNSTLQYQLHIKYDDLLSLGLCLPASCSADELGKILNKIFESRTLAIGNLYSADYRLHEVRDLKDDHKWLLDWRIITTGIVVILTILFVIIGTFYDCIVHQKRLEKLEISKNLEPDSSTTSKGKIRPKLFEEVLLCFSIYTNTKTISNTKLSKNSVTSINGFRLLGMTWIFFMHAVIYSNDALDNRVTGWRLSEEFVNQILTSGSLSVDTYFCLSGFLISWSFFGKRMNDNHEAKSVLRFPWFHYFGLIFKRIVRLAPVYLVIIGIAEIIFGWFKINSSYAVAEDPHYYCHNNWWRNLLFINNLFKWNEACLTWTWYIASDLQFYTIGTFLLLLSDIYFYTSGILLLTLLIVPAIISGCISYSYGYITTLDQMWVIMEVVYTPPWMRIGPYLIGMITGYILRRINGKLNVSRKTLCLLWIVGSLCNIATLFGLYGKNLSAVSAGIYVALSRIAWGIGISWILVACYTNNSGFVNKILSLKIWIPLCKLTYCAYLLNPLITMSLAIFSETPTHAELIPFFIHFLGLTFFTFLCAFFMSVLFEIPYILLVQMFLNPRNRNKN
ncbi:nose resistant to fluoxetine protein 6-like [Microplitis mediator]|uniref:nose resistant to fluoxetine protein 6-like n=1 Tax=Microplitis mediator TaxID=375433 RepID=UPI00255517D5|nr:nose resistant to fluoxetine protein 6-like [Microplitis mediator]